MQRENLSTSPLQFLKSRARIGMFMCPGTTRQLHSKTREILGVQHSKIYAFDDVVVLSGANLSESYYTNRQDRYLVIRDPQVANFAHEVVSTLYNLSIDLPIHDDLKSEKIPVHLPHPLKQTDAFSMFCKSRLQVVMNRHRQKEPLELNPGESLVVPAFQFGLVNYLDDSMLTMQLLRLLGFEEGWQSILASGYLNFPGYYERLICNSENSFQILAPSEHANGFHKGQGSSGFVPKIYSSLNSKLFNLIQDNANVSMYQYTRDNWTFHCKGLWSYRADNEHDCLTSIGSSNFGEHLARILILIFTQVIVLSLEISSCSF
jgi:CDP-diacylglycerol--glycerol-3-phosphate 3-phosphatidyltransferase